MKRSSGRHLGRWIAIALGGLAAIGIVQFVRTRARKHTSPVMFGVTINRTPEEVFTVFRDLAQLPRFMTWLESVHERPDGTSHWVAKLVGRTRVAWDAEITEEVDGRLLAWRTTGGAPLAHSGRVTFTRAPGRDSTEVRVEMAFDVPVFGRTPLLAKLLAKPQIKSDLRHLKQILEIGEVVFSDASVHPSKPHPAQPPLERPAVVDGRAVLA